MEIYQANAFNATNHMFYSMAFARLNVPLDSTLQLDYVCLAIIYVRHAINNSSVRLVVGDLSISITHVSLCAQMVLFLIHSPTIRIANSVANHAKNAYHSRCAWFARPITFWLKESVYRIVHYCFLQVIPIQTL